MSLVTITKCMTLCLIYSINTENHTLTSLVCAEFLVHSIVISYYYQFKQKLLFFSLKSQKYTTFEQLAVSSTSPPSLVNQRCKDPRRHILVLIAFIQGMLNCIFIVHYSFITKNTYKRGNCVFFFSIA